MKRTHVTTVALVVSAWVALAAGAAASSAPQYVDSEPGDGEEVHKAPAEVSITFSEPLDSSSQIEVVDECGQRVDSGDTQVALTQTTMSVGLVAKPSGHYEVDYTATGVAGVTGTTKGSFHFTAHAGPSCDGSDGGHDHGGDGTDDGHGGKHGEGEHAEGAHGFGTHEHAAAAGDDHAAHIDGADDGHHGEHAAGEHKDQEDPVERAKRERDPKLTLGESPFPELEPDSWAVFVALTVSVALGAGGGVFLRAIGS